MRKLYIISYEVPDGYERYADGLLKAFMSQDKAQAFLQECKDFIKFIDDRTEKSKVEYKYDLPRRFAKVLQAKPEYQKFKDIPIWGYDYRVYLNLAEVECDEELDEMIEQGFMYKGLCK